MPSVTSSVPSADRIVVANTKGFTGHAMGVGIEDVLAVKALETGIVPPIANVKEVDPDLGHLNLSKGGRVPGDVCTAPRRRVRFADQHVAPAVGRQPRRQPRRGRRARLRLPHRRPGRWVGMAPDVSGYDVISPRGRPSLAPHPRRRAAGGRAPLPPAGSRSPGSRSRSRTGGRAPPPACSDAVAPVAPVAPPLRRLLRRSPPPSARCRDRPAIPWSDVVLGIVAARRAIRPTCWTSNSTSKPTSASTPSNKPKPSPPSATIRHRTRRQPLPARLPDPRLGRRLRPRPRHRPPRTHRRRDPQPAARRTAGGLRRPATRRGRPLRRSGRREGPRRRRRTDRLSARDARPRTRPRSRPRHRHRQTSRNLRRHPRPIRHRTRRQPLPARLPHPRLGRRLRPRPRHRTPRSTRRCNRDRAAGGSDPAGVTWTPPPRDPVVEMVLAIVAAQTGYPPEMLDPELDLEADLGIDTVKQAETFAAIRDEYDIERDDNLSLRDYPTLASVVGFVRDRATGLPAAPTAAATAAPACRPRRGRPLRPVRPPQLSRRSTRSSRRSSPSSPRRPGIRPRCSTPNSTSKPTWASTPSNKPKPSPPSARNTASNATTTSPCATTPPSPRSSASSATAPPDSLCTHRCRDRYRAVRPRRGQTH